MLIVLVPFWYNHNKFWGFPMVWVTQFTACSPLPILHQPDTRGTPGPREGYWRVLFPDRSFAPCRIAHPVKHCLQQTLAFLQHLFTLAFLAFCASHSSRLAFIMACRSLTFKTSFVFCASVCAQEKWWKEVVRMLLPLSVPLTVQWELLPR